MSANQTNRTRAQWFASSDAARTENEANNEQKARKVVRPIEVRTGQRQAFATYAAEKKAALERWSTHVQGLMDDRVNVVQFRRSGS
jgi:hypothetical protein